MMGVDCAHNIEQPSCHDECGPVCRAGGHGSFEAPLHCTCHQIETTGADVADEGEHLKHIAGVGSVDLAVHQNAEVVHQRDAGEEDSAAIPFFLHEMSGAGDDPAYDA